MRKLLITGFIVILLSLGHVHASSVFSSGGIGIDVSNQSARADGLGGADIAYSDSVYFPLDNPAGWISAGYTRITMTTAAFSATAKDASGKDTNGDLTFPHGAISIPIYKSLTLGLAYSTVKDYRYLTYNYTQFAPTIPYDTSVTEYTVTNRLQGEGGLSKVSAVTAGKILKNVAVGAALDYYFGNTEDLITKDGVSERTGQYIKNKFEGVGFRGGLLVNLNEKLTLAGTLTLPAELRISRTKVVQGGDSLSLGSGTYDLPMSFSIGGSYNLERWRASAEFEMNMWKDGTHDFINAEEYANANKIGFGIERLPNRSPIASRWDKITYRAGLHRDSHYVYLGGNELVTQGISLGIGLPIRYYPGVLDFSFTLDFRGSQADNKASETIYGFKLSFSSAEKWFVKRKR